MKATLLKRGATPDHSFSVARHDFPYFLKVWHYHVELELVYIVRSEGTRFIGDNIDRFQAGELILIGSNLPHMYQNDNAYFEPDSKKRAEAHAIHFNPTFLNTTFSDIPELVEFHTLMEKAKLGLKFSARTVELVGPKIEALDKVDDLSRMLGFLAILADLCKDGDAKTIASSGFVNHFEQAGDLKLDKVYDYVMHHFQEDINVDDIADLVSMNKSSFCRYFKRTTQKTFTEFLNEIRIGFACKMLVERQMGILEISYYCGYNNISHFNRQFKKKMGLSPSAYLLSRKA
ncbi:AraC family transcriptional regulator [Roseivirga sp. E12]|uniref:AraC family transcriptional regulator n=1 Tax=Roseivirga sp. E12 TaxID=2819237 RepID=UPI001ABCE39B|nr:AraC family transcriptional regulator [Roseivirga sp. E12]